MRYFPNPYVDSNGEIRSSLALPSENSCANESILMIRQCLRSACQLFSSKEANLYTGGVGIIWAALRIIHKFPSRTEDLLPSIRSYVEFIVQRIFNNPPHDNEEKLSLLLGRPGLMITAAYYYHLTGDIGNRDQFLQLYGQLSEEVTALQVYRKGSDELFIGRAGYLCGLYELRKITSQSIVSDETIFAICDAMIESGLAYAKSHRSECPLMYAYYDTEYLECLIALENCSLPENHLVVCITGSSPLRTSNLRSGAGHGLAGILFALMLFPGYLQEKPQAVQLIRDSIDYLISVTPEDTGNLPSATDELPPRERPIGRDLVHWCHGAAGAIYVYARAYQLWMDQKYLDEVFKCADVAWLRGLLKKGPGICHGVAGSGYAQLTAYRASGCREKRFEQRARACAAFMQEDEFRHNARRPDNPYSLFEGLAGTACFLADLGPGCADQSAFPFMDAFAPVL